jgi:hypothetical protein
MLNHLLNLFRIGNVQGEGQRRIPEALTQVGDIGKPAGGGGDVIATLQSGLSPDSAEAARGASDKPCLVHIASPYRYQPVDGSGLRVIHVL